MTGALGNLVVREANGVSGMPSVLRAPGILTPGMEGGPGDFGIPGRDREKCGIPGVRGPLGTEGDDGKRGLPGDQTKSGERGYPSIR